MKDVYELQLHHVPDQKAPAGGFLKACSTSGFGESNMSRGYSANKEVGVWVPLVPAHYSGKDMGFGINESLA